MSQPPAVLYVCPDLARPQGTPCGAVGGRGSPKPGDPPRGSWKGQESTFPQTQQDASPATLFRVRTEVQDSRNHWPEAPSRLFTSMMPVGQPLPHKEGGTD